MAVKLVVPGCTIVLDTGQTWHVVTGNRDLIAWDRTAAKHKWPSFRDAPFLWVTFLGWHASRRQGLLPEPMTFEVFESRCEQIEPDDDPDDDDAGEVGPTVPDPGSG